MSLLAAALCAILVLSPVSEDLPPLRIIYAGDLDTDHTRAFQEFLGKHFPEVNTIPVTDLGKADLSGGDVLIVDGKVLRYKEGGAVGGARPGPQGVSLEKLGIPTVLVGGMGGRVSDSLKLKLGWRYG